MFVLQGTTPEEVKNSVLELLEQEAARHERSSKSARLKGEAAQDRARANALRNVWHMLKHSTLADLNAMKEHATPAFTPKVVPGNPVEKKSTDDTK
jgi:hypothetical protein